MNAVPFDTLKLARDLEAAGLTAPVAGGAAAALADALTGADLATRADLAATRAELKSDIAATRADLMARIEPLATRAELNMLDARMQAGFAAIEARFVAVDGKLELLRRDMTIKLGGMLFLGVGILLAAMRLMPHP